MPAFIPSIDSLVRSLLQHRFPHSCIIFFSHCCSIKLIIAAAFIRSLLQHAHWCITDATSISFMYHDVSHASPCSVCCLKLIVHTACTEFRLVVNIPPSIPTHFVLWLAKRSAFPMIFCARAGRDCRRPPVLRTADPRCRAYILLGHRPVIEFVSQLGLST